MLGRMIQDVREFHDKLKALWKKDMKELLRRGEIQLPRPDGGVVIVPVDRIYIPRLHFSPLPEDAEIPNEEESGEGDGQGEGNAAGDRGIARGPGKPGTILGPVPKGDGEGEEGEDKSAGQGRGDSKVKVAIPPEDLMELLREILELPWIQPKGSKKIKTETWKYSDIQKQGPRSLLHKRRTMREALKRSLATGVFDPNEPKFSPIREDFRFRIPEKIIKPKNNAVIFYAMDVSGSMGMRERRIVRFLCTLCSFWLSWNYDGLAEEYIIHDGEADRVTREEFFSTYRGGGTVSSTAHELMMKLIETEYPPSEWNIYVIYLSDGFNWGDDNERCMEIIKDKMLPAINQYAYGEVEFQYRPRGGSFSQPGNFGSTLAVTFSEGEHVAWSSLREMEDVQGAVKEFFKKGR